MVLVPSRLLSLHRMLALPRYMLAPAPHLVARLPLLAPGGGWRRWLRSGTRVYALVLYTHPPVRMPSVRQTYPTRTHARTCPTAAVATHPHRHPGAGSGAGASGGSGSRGNVAATTLFVKVGNGKWGAIYKDAWHMGMEQLPLLQAARAGGFIALADVDVMECMVRVLKAERSTVIPTDVDVAGAVPMEVMDTLESLNERHGAVRPDGTMWVHVVVPPAAAAAPTTAATATATTAATASTIVVIAAAAAAAAVAATAIAADADAVTDSAGNDADADTDPGSDAHADADNNADADNDADDDADADDDPSAGDADDDADNGADDDADDDATATADDDDDDDDDDDADDDDDDAGDDDDNGAELPTPARCTIDIRTLAVRTVVHHHNTRTRPHTRYR